MKKIWRKDRMERGNKEKAADTLAKEASKPAVAKSRKSIKGYERNAFHILFVKQNLHI